MGIQKSLPGPKKPAFEGKYSLQTEKIIGAFYKVYNALGYGFLEKVYQEALAMELDALGMHVESQKPIQVFYQGQMIGEYFADLVVDEVILLELKTVRQLGEEHEAQLLNYLKSTMIEVGLLLNFGPKPAHVRKVFDNSLKGALTWVGKKK